MPYDPERHGPKRFVGPGFHEQVYEVVRKVPKGRVTTYGDVGGSLGSKRIARHVGFALAALGNGRDRRLKVPWHRVVNSRGEISFPLDDDRGREQVKRLSLEGIEVNERGRVVGFRDLRW